MTYKSCQNLYIEENCILFQQSAFFIYKQEFRYSLCRIDGAIVKLVKKSFLMSIVSRGFF